MWIKIKAVLIVGTMLAVAGLVCYTQPIFFMATMVLAAGGALMSWLTKNPNGQKKKG